MATWTSESPKQREQRPKKGHGAKKNVEMRSAKLTGHHQTVGKTLKGSHCWKMDENAAGSTSCKKHFLLPTFQVFALSMQTKHSGQVDHKRCLTHEMMNNKVRLTKNSNGERGKIEKIHMF